MLTGTVGIEAVGGPLCGLSVPEDDGWILHRAAEYGHAYVLVTYEGHRLWRYAGLRRPVPAMVGTFPRRRWRVRVAA